MKKMIIVLLLSGCATDHEWKGQRMINYCFLGMSYVEQGESERGAAVEHPFQCKNEDAEAGR
jgi:hypothetical protein